MGSFYKSASYFISIFISLRRGLETRNVQFNLFEGSGCIQDPCSGENVHLGDPKILESQVRAGGEWSQAGLDASFYG